MFSMSCSAPVDSPTSAIFTATSGNTCRASSAAANDSPSRTRALTMSSCAAMYWLPTDLRGDVERVDERQAAAEQRRQRPRHLRGRELRRDRRRASAAPSSR